MVANINVKRKIGSQRGDAELGAKIRLLREEKLQCDQKSFALMLGVSQAIISQWESGKYMPSAMALMAIGNLAGTDRDWWYERAGTFHQHVDRLVQADKKLFDISRDENRTILVYHSAGAGPFRFIPEDAEEKLSLPRTWFGDSAGLIGLQVKGESMQPLIFPRDIVIVDRRKTTFPALNNCIAAISDGEGVSVKYVRKQAGRYLLVPANISLDNAIIPVKDNHNIVGEVVAVVRPPRMGNPK